MADIGERLGGDDLNISIDQPLRIIIGGPPHSGKSTLMNLLEDRFQYYQIPVQLLDLDLSAPTPLKTGFTEQREKRKWTSSLADEAKSMFEQAEGVQVVLGDSVGLISEINEIISQPADVAILLVSGGHGDYDTTYRKVVRKWKEYYEDIRKPLLVVLRSTMNPADESMFDPRDNYGVIAGLDRDAYQSKVISGHYQYTGEYPTNACLEGIVFEIAQSFDLKVRSATDPDHLAILNQKWPDLKDKKTWTPPSDSMLGGIERAYFDERGRVPADQRAEAFGAEGREPVWVKTFLEERRAFDGSPKSRTWVEGYFSSYDAAMKDAKEEEDSYRQDYRYVKLFEKDGMIRIDVSDKQTTTITYQEFKKLGAEYYTKYYLPNRLAPEVGDEAMFEGGEIRITAMERNPDVIFYTYLDEDGKSDGFIHTRDKAKFVDRWTPFPMEKDTVILSNYGDKDDLSFKEWADQEMLTHGKKESFDDWLNDELSHHGDNMTLQDWGQHELDSHYERYGADSFDLETHSGHEVQWDDGSFYMTFKEPIDGYGEVNGYWYGGANQSPDEISLDVEPAWNEETDEEYDVPSLYIQVDEVEHYGIRNHNMTVSPDGSGVRASRELLDAIQEGLEGMVADHDDKTVVSREYRAENMARFEIMPSVHVEGIGIVSGPLVREYSYLTGGRIDDYDIYDDDAAEEIMSIPANDPRFPLQEGELELIEAMVYGHSHPRINDSWGELNEDGMFWASKVMETLSNYQAYAAEDNLKALKAIYNPYIGKQVRFITKYGLDKDDMFVDIETIHSIDWDGGEDEYDEPVFLNKEGDRWMTLDYVKENLVENKEAEEKIHSQLMIGSLIGLGAGLWAVNRFKESREEK